MRIGVVVFLGGALAGCGVENDNVATDSPYFEAPAPSIAAPSIASSETVNTPLVQSAQSKRAYYYDVRDGVFYSYVAALSEDDRKAGKAAGKVVTFAYLGRRGDKHVLARIKGDGTVLDEAFCSEPCRVISYADGEQLAFNESSIIGAAFADAIAGRLEVASYTQPSQQIMPAPRTSSSIPTPTKQTNTSVWSGGETDLILGWMEANSRCQGEADPELVADACANRDNIFGPALAEKGICYGRVNEPASASKMHRCESDSLPLN